MNINITKIISLNFGLLTLAYIFLAYNADPPEGFTGAPGEATCMASGCHSGGTFGGNVVISGLPSTIEANHAYNITVTLNNTSGNAFKGGFELVALNSLNNNAGDLTALDTDHGTDIVNGKEYVEHRLGKEFISNTVSWTFQWTSPNGPNGMQITMYASGNFTDGSGNSLGDNVKLTTASGIMMAGSSNMDVSIVSTNISCNGDANGTAFASVSGGTPPYTFNWNNGSMNQSLNNLSAGVYKVTVTDSNSETSTAQTTITQPTAVMVNLPNAVLTCLNPQQTLSSNVSGGTGAYTYEWNTGESTSSIVVDGAGLYSLTVTDVNNCTKVKTSTVTSDMQIPEIDIVPPGILSCSQPVIELSSSCNPASNYLWTTTDGHIITGQNSLLPLIDKAGEYILRAINPATGCTAYDTVHVIGVDPVVGSATQININCYGDSTGKLSISAVGGLLPYKYSWSSGDTTSTIDSLKAGTYTVIIRDHTTCKDTLILVVTQSDKLEALMSNTGLTGPSNHDATATVTPLGGVGPYEVLWNTNDTIFTITGLASGLYTAGLTDSLGCFTSQSTYINPYNCGLIVNSSSIPVSCYGGLNGVLCVNTIGGTFPYSYNWDTGGNTNCIQNLPAGIHSVTITDAVGCIEIKQLQVYQPDEIIVDADSIIVFGETGNEYADGMASLIANGGVPPFSYSFDNGTMGLGTGLASGKHNVTVTDAKGCTKVVEINIPAYPCETLGIKFVNFQFAATCANAPVTICVNTIIGGVEPYAYTWPNGTFQSCSTDFISNINVVTITDGKNCPAKFFINYTMPDTIKIDLSVKDVNFGQSNGSITVNGLKGGTAPYTYLWSGPDGFSSTSKDLNDIPVGIYCVTVTDANGCSNSKCVEVKVKVSTVNLSDEGWKLYPNPARDYIVLQKVNNTIESLSWEILNEKGSVLLNGAEVKDKPALTIDIHNLISGNYYLRIVEKSGKSLIGKFVK